MEEKIYLKRKQKTLKNAMESGRLNPEQQYGLIETTIDELLISKDISYEAVKLHEDKVDKLMGELEQKQKELSEHYKFFYEKLLEL